VAATGEVARALARKLLAREDGALARLRGVAGPELLVLLGEAEALPWVDGVVYLGRDEQAPSLLLPSNRAPAVPPALLERALLARAGAGDAPLAVLLDPPRLVPTGSARTVARERLSGWLDAGGRA
jgi:hypothetical protein